MNYFTHAIRFLDDGVFAVGTAIPDWLSAADRRVRLRPRDLESWVKHDDPWQAGLASGAAQHLHDDGWFHVTTGFYEVTASLTQLFRQGLGGGEQYHCGFLGHVGMELLLDAALIARHPNQLEQYFAYLAGIDSSGVQAAVNRMTRVPTERLAWMIDEFREEQFLRDYLDDEQLRLRLNQVLWRVKLSPLPAVAVRLLGEARQIVSSRVGDLLPADLFANAGRVTEQHLEPQDPREESSP